MTFIKTARMGLMACALVGFAAFAAPVDDLMASLKHIQTFDAHFEQNIQDDKGKKVSQSEGVLTIQKPGRFYWKSVKPDQVVVVADGKVIWSYDMELEQIVKHNQAKTLGQSPAGLLAGNGVNLNKDYDIALGPNTLCGKGVEFCYKLSPRDKEGQFKEILIGFHEKTLTMINMRDMLQQHIQTRFSNVKTNVKVDTALFAFKPPAGVDIIQGNP